ncbi:MAG: hypothetical protein KJI69_03675 [Patescibacteria group bacterium]|nr:hypothetical protein [Patescibacteria group bacterium]
MPRDLIIEAENEYELKDKIKKITIENLVFSSGRITKEKFKEELESRYVYLKLKL